MSNLFDSPVIRAEGKRFEDFQEGLVTYFRQIFPDTPKADEPLALTQMNIGYYPDVEERIDTPFLILDSRGFSPVSGYGSTRVQLRTHFEATLLLDPTLTSAQAMIRNYAMMIASHLYQAPYPIVGHGVTSNIVAAPEKIEILSDRYLVWSIKWEMPLLYQGSIEEDDCMEDWDA